MLFCYLLPVFLTAVLQLFYLPGPRGKSRVVPCSTTPLNREARRNLQKKLNKALQFGYTLIREMEGCHRNWLVEANQGGTLPEGRTLYNISSAFLVQYACTEGSYGPFGLRNFKDDNAQHAQESECTLMVPIGGERYGHLTMAFTRHQAPKNPLKRYGTRLRLWARASSIEIMASFF